MKESFKTEKPKSIILMEDVLKRKQEIKQEIFDANDKESLNIAEKKLETVLNQERILIEIDECKKKIEDIDRARTEGRLSARYEYSTDHENLASAEVQKLEDRIHELEKAFNSDVSDKNEGEGDDSKAKPDEQKNNEEKSPEDVPNNPKDAKGEDLSLDKKNLDSTKDEADRIREKRKKLGVVKTDLVEKRAQDIAAERMTADKNSLKGVSGFFKKIWKHNWGAEINRAKETKKIKAELAEVGSAFAPDDIRGSKDRAIKESVLKRFLEDAPDLIHTDTGEWKDSNISIEKRAQAEVGLQNAIRAYAVSPDPIQAELDFKAERDRIYAGLFADKNGSFDALGVADNVFDFAKEIRGQVEHGIAIADLDLDFELTFGEAKTGVRTEANYGWSERMIKKISSMPGGRFFNETFIAAAVSVVPMLGQSSSRMGAKALMGFGAGVLVAGGIAGLRESQAIKRDKTEHARAMASGRSFDPISAPRRAELESAMYEMMSAKNATEDLHNMLFENVGGIEREKVLDQNDIDIAMSYLSKIDARIKLSDINKIDLLGYSDEAMVEIERTNLDIERARAKSILRRAFSANPSLGVFDDRMNTLVDARQIELNDDPGGIKEKDAAFKKIKRTHIAKAMAKGVIGGLAFGVLAQEGASLINGQQGVVESLRGVGHSENVTSLEWAREKIYAAFGWDSSISGPQISVPGQSTVSALAIGGASHEVTQSVNSILKLPAGYEINPSGSHRGVYDILFNGKQVAQNVEVDLNTGELTSNSLSVLKKAGFNIDTKVDRLYDSVAEGTKGTEPSLTQDFIDKHSEKFAKIKRLGWADNGTPRPDQNELKLWDPVEKAGKYEYAVKMNHFGSLFGRTHIDPVKLASEGKLKALFSLSKETQGHPIEVPIKYVGGKMTFEVDPKDPILGQLFHKAPNGEIICDARYVEVGAEMGSKNGVKEFVMCATEEGKGVSKMGGEATNMITKDYLTKNVNINLEKPGDIVLPPIIPIIPRTPLEPTKKGEKPRVSPYYGIANPKEILDEMEKNGVEPDPYFVKNIEGENVWVDKTGKPIERSKDREKERVEKYLDKQDKTFVEELQAFEKQVEPMNEKCRVAINIPARFEEKNLANLLTQYVKQVGEDGKPIDKDLFEINIIVNRKEGEKADRSLQIVQDWKKKNPGYHVNVIDTVFSKEKANVGMARKYITDLTLLRSKNRAISTGPLYIESEDADLFGVDKRTVAKLIKDFDSKPHIDVLRGVQDRQPEIMQKNDLLFFERRLGDMAETFMRKQAYRPEKMKGSSFVWNRVISGGWNTAFTAESYAQIGGYVSDVIGEDMKVGQKISMLRGFKNEKGEYIPNTQTSRTSGLRFSSSPRRFIDSMIKSRGAYDDFEDQSLKEKTLDELMDGISEYSIATPEQIKKYENSIGWVGKFIGEQMVQPQAGDVFKRVLWGIGLREGHYVLKGDNSIELSSAGMERIIDLLKKYKEGDKYKLGYRRQNTNLPE